MQRKWYVLPHPETGAVEPEDLGGAMTEAAVVLLRMGGVLGVVQQRQATGLPGEMRSAVVVIEWKDRTDASEQPERPVQIVEVPEPGEAEPEGETGGEKAEPVLTEDVYEKAAVGSIGDGLDESALEEEDFDSVPESAR